MNNKTIEDHNATWKKIANVLIDDEKKPYSSVTINKLSGTYDDIQNLRLSIKNDLFIKTVMIGFNDGLYTKEQMQSEFLTIRFMIDACNGYIPDEWKIESDIPVINNNANNELDIKIKDYMKDVITMYDKLKELKF